MKYSQESGFILHSYDYRESSLIVEVFTRNHGRHGLVAKGARRWKKRGTRTYLRPFQEFSFSWSGKGEVATLTLAEEEGPIRSLNKEALYCGFYVNELVMRLLYRHDPHEQLYDYYRKCLEDLATSSNLESILRLFEKRMLLEIGYGLNLDTDIENGLPVEAGKQYSYLPNMGPSGNTSHTDGLDQCRISGKSLLAFKNETLDDPGVLAELKQLMRKLIDHQLNYKPLISRNIFVSGSRRGLKPESNNSRS
ncbi:MAG: DNA repair protein RecO [Acidiferrobacterales bacterium]